MRIKRPKTKTKKCYHCKRRRRAKFIEWHPGIWQWQCSDFVSCNEAETEDLVKRAKPGLP